MMLLNPLSQDDDELQSVLLPPRPSPNTRIVFQSVYALLSPVPEPSHASATVIGPSTKYWCVKRCRMSGMCNIF